MACGGGDSRVHMHEKVDQLLGEKRELDILFSNRPETHDIDPRQITPYLVNLQKQSDRYTSVLSQLSQVFLELEEMDNWEWSREQMDEINEEVRLVERELRQVARQNSNQNSRRTSRNLSRSNSVSSHSDSSHALYTRYAHDNATNRDDITNRDNVTNRDNLLTHSRSLIHSMILSHK